MCKGRPPFEPEQEVRFAVVMYGGVSLAVYINGVAQELFRLARATAPDSMTEPVESQSRVYFGGSDDPDERRRLTGSELVYRELGQILGAADLQSSPVSPEAPVRSRFVVDILSGTSAGGINGILLAKALADQEDFRRSAGLWLNVADIDELLDDKRSYEGLPNGTPHPSAPPSLLNGYRLYWKARAAMDDMAAGRETPRGQPGGPSYVDQLDLAVTTTDLAGLPVAIRLSEGCTVNELSHRKALRFAYGTHATTGQEHNDFDGHADLVLGFAARATSSFPAAFEPVRLADLASLNPAEFARTDATPYLADEDQPEIEQTTRFFADGGYLDNKPFTYATQALRRRRADVPVDRKLLFIEPDPAPAAATVPSGEAHRPDVYENVADAMLLPRYETIRQDVAAVAQRNIVVQRLRAIERDAEKAVEAETDPLAGLSHVTSPGPDDVVNLALGPIAPLYAAYLTLRVRIVLDMLTELAVALRAPTAPSLPPAAIRDALRYALTLEWTGRQREFLARTDAAFLQRRLSFVQDRINDLLRRDAHAEQLIAVARRASQSDSQSLDELANQAERLRAVKQALNNAFDGLRRAERAVSMHAAACVLDERERPRFDRLDAIADELVTDPDAATRFIRAVQDYLESPLRLASDGISAALSSEGLQAWTRDLLIDHDRRFETFDMIVLPLAYPDLGEVNAVDIVRVSPRDATSILPAGFGDPVDKLAGIRLGHFGAFLKRSWRENDLMWGRLDAAESIIDVLLPDAPDDQRERLRVRAQASILREALTGPLAVTLKAEIDDTSGMLADRTLVKRFQEQYTPCESLDAGRAERLMGKSLKVAGKMLAAQAKDRHQPAFLLRWAGRLGPVIAFAVRRSAPLRARRRRWNPLGRRKPSRS